MNSVPRASFSTARAPRRLQLRSVLLTTAVGAVVVLFAVTTSRSPTLALGLGALVVVAATTVRFHSPAIAVGVLAAAYGALRLGPASTNLSAADGVLLVGALAALPFIPWQSARLRRILFNAIAYGLILALAVLAHPTARAALEWGHRILLIAGAVLVGAALARARRVGPAFRLYFWVSVVVALASCAYALAHGLAPAYPFGLQKNDVGLLLAFAFLISVVAPVAAGVPARLVNPMRIVFIVGLLSTQSRGSMLALIAVLGFQQLRGRQPRRAIVLVVFAVLAMGAVTLAVTQKQANTVRLNPLAAKYSGVGARETTYKQALTIWSDSRLFGAGLRYFRDPAFKTTEPHDVAVISLAESGVVGLAALLLLLTSTWLALGGLRGELATLARCAFVIHLLAGLVDIYWVAGRGSFAWVIAGMAVGAYGSTASSAPFDPAYA